MENYIMAKYVCIFWSIASATHQFDNIKTLYL